MVVGRGATSTTVIYGTQVPDTTEVVPPVAVQTITGPTGSTRQFVVDAAVTPTVTVGEIVAVGSTPAGPAGVLGRVVAQQSGGASTRLTVVPVDLRDAVPVADFEATLPAERVEATVDSDAAGTVAATSTVPGTRAAGLGAADQRSAAGGVLPANRWKPVGSSGDVVQVRQRSHRWRGPLWELVRDSGTQPAQRDAVSDEHFGWHCGGLPPF